MAGGVPRRRLRAAVVAVHRYAGLAMAGFLAVAALTGIPLAFYPELDAALNPSLFRVVPRGHPPLGPDALAARLDAALPAASIVGFDYRPSPRDSVRVLVAPRRAGGAGASPPLGYDEVFADPYDGRVLGMRAWGAARADAAHLMPFVYQLHYSLHLPGRVGVVLMGTVALLWMVDCFAGFYLTLPAAAGRGWWLRWGTAWRIKRGASGVRLNLDLHRASGLWFWPVAFVLAMTSATLNLDGEVARPAVRVFSDLSPDPFDRLPALSEPRAPAIGYAAAVAAAQAALDPESAGDPASYVSHLADHGAYWIAFTPAGKANGFFVLRFAHVFVDAASGAVLAHRSYARGTAGDKFMDWQFPLHSGQVLGLPGRILVGLSGVAVAALSITGVIVWWHKRRARRGAAARHG